MHHIINHILCLLFSSQGQSWAQYWSILRHLQKFYCFLFLERNASYPYMVMWGLILSHSILLLFEVHSPLLYHINLTELLNIKELLLQIISVFCPVHFLFTFSAFKIFLTWLITFLINMPFTFHLLQFILC